MLPGGDGYYYFSTYLLGPPTEYSNLDIQINGDTLCTVILEQQFASGDVLQSTCSAATCAAEGIFGSFKFPKLLSKIFLYFTLSFVI